MSSLEKQCDISNIEKINTIDSYLLEGIEVENQQQFDQLFGVLQDEKIIKSVNADFDQVGYGFRIAIKKNKPDDKFLTIFSLAEPNVGILRGLPRNKIGEIDFDGNFTGKIDKSVKYTSFNNNQIDYILAKQNRLFDKQKHSYFKDRCNTLKKEVKQDLKHLSNQEKEHQNFLDKLDGVNDNEIKNNNNTVTHTTKINDQILADTETLDQKVDIHTHQVEKGDTIWDIILNKVSGDKAQTARILNDLKNNSNFTNSLPSQDINRIYPGDTITFPEGIFILKEEVSETPEGYSEYKVNSGDTLYTIVKSQYPDLVRGYGSFLNTFNTLKKDKNFEIKDVNEILKIGQKIYFPKELK